MANIDELKRLVEMGMMPREALEGYAQGVAQREEEYRRHRTEYEELKRRYAQNQADYERGRYYPVAPSTTSSQGTGLTEKTMEEAYKKLIEGMQPAIDKLEYPWKIDPYGDWGKSDEEEMEKMRKAEAEAREKARKAAAEARARKIAQKRANILAEILGYEIQETQTKNKRLE